jgi:hypothetical protein
VTIEVSEKPHATLGASGWHTWSACPGSIPLGEGIPSSSSSYAKEGTAAHALLEKCLLEDAQPEDLLGEEIIVEGTVYIVDQEMADAINSTIDIVKSYAGEDGIIMAEAAVPLQHITGEQDAEGTLDVAVVSDKGTMLTIIDLKYGQGVMVYASDFAPEGALKQPNGQLAMYASGWLHKHGFMYEDIQKIRLVVAQPRMEWHDEHEINIDQLREFEDRVREAAGAVELNRQVAAEGNSLDLNPGEKQCKFCKAKGICPALRNAASTALTAVAAPSDPAEFENLSLPKKAAAITIDQSITNERLGEFMRAVPLVEEAIKAAGEEMMRRLMSGQEIPGFYLGIGRAGARKWENEEVAKKELTKSGRLKVAEATVSKVRSPTQIEKIGKDKRWWAKVAPLIVTPEGGPKICREGVDSNKRYSIASEVSEFANLDAPETIVKTYEARTQNATIVETSTGRSIVITTVTPDIRKLMKVGEPVAPLDAVLPQITIDAEATPVPDLEDVMG